jgi:hypothetical protein
VHTVAEIDCVDPATVHVFQLPAINVIKALVPRRVRQGSIADSDVNSGQQQVPLAQLLVTCPSEPETIDPRSDGRRRPSRTTRSRRPPSTDMPNSWPLDPPPKPAKFEHVLTRLRNVCLRRWSPRIWRGPRPSRAPP